MTEADFAPGQRWVSDAEPDLGLGLVLDAELRRVRLIFPAADEERAYALPGAPLSRLVFRAGECARSEQGWSLEIDEINEHGGLLIYGGRRLDTGETESLPETRLAHDLQINQPRDRLLAGHFDENRWFDLIHESLRHRAALEHSSVRGLIGPRVALIRHQLYIAHEVASRHQPRVLLADEVGLGKTIEAGLILHHQLVTERARRALIIVPESLLSQWVLELMRRFNLNAAIYDEERCAQAQSSTSGNPFEAEQLVLCSLEFLVSRPERAQQAAAASWDLLIVDEAHHLAWSPDEVSEEYRIVESLALAVPGLLLLTATPEQLGASGHFARLRLLDPDRYADLASWQDEEAGYARAAQDIDELRGRGEDIRELLDRHGTGRVMFRNTRAHVPGFPERHLHSHALPNPYASPGLHPERDAGEDWAAGDPRVSWLEAFCKARKDKVLVICAHKETAVSLEQTLNFQRGVRCAAFHEGLGLLARDRAAAWFAEEGGAQALICSEIGSEGRNFQFAHHLVLFDLPADPDLLEQRIGRLDRIGQGEAVQIHVPYLENSAQAVLLRWYHEGLDAFAQCCPSASRLKALLGESLQGQLERPNFSALQELIDATRIQREALGRELEQGRDHLLELGSCDDERGDALIQELAAITDREPVMDYLARAADCFGIEVDEHNEHSVILRRLADNPGGFGDISDDGITVTAHRLTALAHEGYKFLTFEHPLVTEMLDRALGGHLGNCTAGLIPSADWDAGTLLLECLYTPQVIAPRALQLGKFLAPEMLRVVVDSTLSECSDRLPFEALDGCVTSLDTNRLRPLLKRHRDQIDRMIETATDAAEPAHQALLGQAAQRVEQDLVPELDRLRHLHRVNPNVRASEIDHLERHVERVRAALGEVHLRLVAVRLLIVMGG